MKRLSPALLKPIAGLALLAGLAGLAMEAGWLDGWEQGSVGARFRARGPIESTARVYYVNRDPAASQHFGKQYFPREYYALAAEGLLSLGGARTVFLDFVLTDDHLPDVVASELTYPGNVALQRLLLAYPGQVILGSAYNGKRYRFSSYGGGLPDRRAGPFRITPTGAVGYDAARNHLPDLPEFPLWCPPIEDPVFGQEGLGRIGLIDTSESLNFGEAVYFVPGYVEVEGRAVSLFLANGMRRWQETVAVQTGRGGERFTAREEGARFVVENGGGEVLNGLPQSLPQTFWAASLEMLRQAYPGSEWAIVGHGLELRGAAGEVHRRVPLVDRQHLAVNWHSPWFTGFPEQLARWEAEAAEEARTGAENWDVGQIGRQPEAWIAAVEAGDPRAIDPIRPWGEPNDPYNPQVSIADVLYLYDAYLLAEERGAEAARSLLGELFRQFADCHILIGPTDVLLQDLAPTPFDENPQPKVAVHGNLLKTLVDGRFLRFAPAWFGWVAIVGLVFAVGACAMRRGRRSWWWSALAAGLLLGYGVLAFALFGPWDVVLPVIGPMGAGLAAGAFGVVTRLFVEERQRRRLRGLFGTYVSPEVVRQMVDSSEKPQLGGHIRPLTAFFTDIEAFSSIGEQLPPEVLVELMNTYLDAMTAILAEERGTLDKYIGDAMVGIFGAPLALPDHAARACVAALRMQREQQRLCELWHRAEPRWPEAVRRMRTRIGIHTGEAVVGNMGSKQRFAYTMMGDSVNLASRLEQLGKTYGVAVIVSEVTREAALREVSDLVFRLLDLVAVKGRKQPVRVFELVGRSESLKGPRLECISLYESAFALYLKRRWTEAEPLFEAAARLEMRPGKPPNPSLLLARRCQIYRERPPPEHWDGAFVMGSK